MQDLYALYVQLMFHTTYAFVNLSVLPFILLGKLRMKSETRKAHEDCLRELRLAALFRKLFDQLVELSQHIYCVSKINRIIGIQSKAFVLTIKCEVSKNSVILFSMPLMIAPSEFFLKINNCFLMADINWS